MFVHRDRQRIDSTDNAERKIFPRIFREFPRDSQLFLRDFVRRRSEQLFAANWPSLQMAMGSRGFGHGDRLDFTFVGFYEFLENRKIRTSFCQRLFNVSQIQFDLHFHLDRLHHRFSYVVRQQETTIPIDFLFDSQNFGHVNRRIRFR